MNSYFIDTNIFLRYLTNDDPAKADRIEKLFNRAKQENLRLVTSHLTIAELVWTLDSYYKLKPSTIEDILLKIINTPFIEIPHVDLILQALDLYVTANIDFIDAYNAHFMREMDLTCIYTYDTRHFKRVEWVEIMQP
ncbi:MAG: type II toxin-antitoxin system VapC family toxin [Calditrichaeota bacterium]|nr:type II toxin-antitoxin system VapC family toxin [Calditrichota bacterium]